jgi:hypothetical protein
VHYRKKIKNYQILKAKQIKHGMNINGFIYAGQDEGRARRGRKLTR